MSELLDKIHKYSMEDIMGERFGRYAKYIIQDRAIPDVRDGLKPVQRRILWAMYKNKNFYDKEYVKSALTVGDVIGKYHPHGDSSVYDAMVRMSQPWKQNVVYIDFQGNNGSIDGDSAAAYRYTETRLAKLSNEIIRDIEKNTVEMAPNFDDSRLEPTVMPCHFPNLLLNGATGISAGYATNIPPHNLNEIIDATIKRIDNPNCRLDTILDIVKGPDFPTGGIVQGKEGIRSAFESGRGKVIVRSKCTIKKEQIIIDEIPFDVIKSNLVRRMNDLRLDKKIEGISDIRDESDKDGLRIVIDLKKQANPNLILNYFYKNSDLQTSYNYNMVAIVNRRPKLLGIIPILDAYINHQKEIIKRRSEYDLAFAKKNSHIIEGLIKALDILDQVIKTIRGSKNKSDAKVNLVKEYNFSVEQAEAIVMLQLYKLTNTDVNELIAEMEKLTKIINFLTEILADENKLLNVVKEELRKIKKEYGFERKTKIEDEIEEIKIDEKEMIVKEKVIIVLTHDGYIKSVSKKSYNEDEITGLKPGDYVLKTFELSTLDNVLIFTNMGRYLFIPVHKIPDGKWKELGKHISNVIITAPNEQVINAFNYEENKEIIIVTKLGMIKRTIINNYLVTRYNKPLTAIKLKENDEVVSVKLNIGNPLIVTHNGYYVYFPMEQVPIVGAKASGVKGINVKDDYVIQADIINDKDEYINIFTNQMTAKRVKISDLESTNRAKKGNTILKKVKQTNYFVQNAFATTSKSIIGLKLDEEYREIKNSEIPIMDLKSTGSLLSKENIEIFFKISEVLHLVEDEKTAKDTPIVKELPVMQELTIDDFMDNFKL